jgi:aldehyde dehydrogenase (NAD+)
MAFDDEDHAAQQCAWPIFQRASIWTRDGARQFRMARRVKWSDLHQQL